MTVKSVRYISRVQDSLKYKTVDTLLFENQQYRRI